MIDPNNLSYFPTFPPTNNITFPTFLISINQQFQNHNSNSNSNPNKSSITKIHTSIHPANTNTLHPTKTQIPKNPSSKFSLQTKQEFIINFLQTQPPSPKARLSPNPKSNTSPNPNLPNPQSSPHLTLPHLLNLKSSPLGQSNSTKTSPINVISKDAKADRPI